MVSAQLTGILPADFKGEVAPTIVFGAPPPAEWRKIHRVDVEDARALQAKAESEAAFFAEHGFVLLPHVTAVRDWDREIASVYHREVEALITERLLPGRKLILNQGPKVVRRGIRNRYYAQFVHSDGPLTADLYAANVGAVGSSGAEERWRRDYERDDVAGIVSIGFWRTTDMNEPLRHMPLALCDPNSIDRADIVPTSIVGVAPEGRATNHVALRFGEGQRWYYYPEITTAEVIAIKLCEYWKDDPDARPQIVFHSAFRHPSTPADAERRRSCEHRASVFIVRE